MKLVQLTAILLLSASILTQRVSAGPLDAIRSFFGGRQQPQTHVHPHPRPVHPTKDTKDAPNESPAPMVSPAPMGSPGDQQPNGTPGQNTLNNNTVNKPGRPSIAAAPLY
jgi:hypothetical protein